MDTKITVEKMKNRPLIASSVNENFFRFAYDSCLQRRALSRE
jgi:hypothetical protein